MAGRSTGRRGAPPADRRQGLQARAARFAAVGEPVRLAIVEHLALGDAAPSELGALVDLPSNLLAHHLKVLEIFLRQCGQIEPGIWQVDALVCSEVFAAVASLGYFHLHPLRSPAVHYTADATII